ncbi:MAG: hypothetical protein EAZ85_12175 [Bacteroidetes bacterium]|nr:MAG: hypothetical protein EAZ85_12175 [Bacteroidota bacterium]TAG85898.1 MAG: hypothetical protein EAZ20_13950 [Bacteroidota bacterium]
MKKNILFLYFFIIFHCVSNAQNGYKELYSDKITVNSANNATFQGGKTREVIKFSIPNKAEGWIWKLFAKKRNTGIASTRKTLLSLVATTYSGTPLAGIVADQLIESSQSKYENCDIYILNSEQDAQAFMQRGNWDFQYIRVWKDQGNAAKVVQDLKGTIYFGIINTNQSIGLDIQLDIILKMPERKIEEKQSEKPNVASNAERKEESPLTPEQLAKKSVNNLTNILSLDDDQKSQIYELILAEIEDVKKERKERKDGFAKKISEIRKKTKNDIREVLNDEQKQKFDAREEARKEKNKD